MTYLPMHLRPAGRCRECGGAVTWNGRRWVGDYPRRAHVCPCGVPGRYGEPCAKAKGHSTLSTGKGHRSRYALDNDNAMRTGRAV